MLKHKISNALLENVVWEVLQINSRDMVGMVSKACGTLA